MAGNNPFKGRPNTVPGTGEPLKNAPFSTTQPAPRKPDTNASVSSSSSSSSSLVPKSLFSSSGRPATIPSISSRQKRVPAEPPPQIPGHGHVNVNLYKAASSSSSCSSSSSLVGVGPFIEKAGQGQTEKISRHFPPLTPRFKATLPSAPASTAPAHVASSSSSSVLPSYVSLSTGGPAAPQGNKRKLLLNPDIFDPALNGPASPAFPLLSFRFDVHFQRGLFDFLLLGAHSLCGLVATRGTVKTKEQREAMIKKTEEAQNMFASCFVYFIDSCPSPSPTRGGGGFVGLLGFLESGGDAVADKDRGADYWYGQYKQHRPLLPIIIYCPGWDSFVVQLEAVKHVFSRDQAEKKRERIEQAKKKLMETVIGKK